jgi:hypothetical protein
MIGPKAPGTRLGLLRLKVAGVASFQRQPLQANYGLRILDALVGKGVHRFGNRHRDDPYIFSFLAGATTLGNARTVINARVIEQYPLGRPARARKKGTDQLEPAGLDAYLLEQFARERILRSFARVDDACRKFEKPARGVRNGRVPELLSEIKQVPRNIVNDPGSGARFRHSWSRRASRGGGALLAR